MTATFSGDFTKDQLRKSGLSLAFNRVMAGNPEAWMDSSVHIEPRKGDAWRVTISDTDQLGAEICHVDTIHAETTNALEVLRIALNAYRDYRGPVRNAAPTLFEMDDQD
ncbi:hypothetical protein [Corynebacterium variabile]|uniref:hypothetical protein n=1 Tax=Corynebacterium variabile TaxID=1727 RepID=UPI003BAFC467